MHSRANAGTTGRYVAAALILCAAVARGGQPEPAGPATSEALALCHEADQVSVAERLAVLARGLDRAEQAVRADPRDAVAHFAVFCNLGKRLEMQRRGGACSGCSAISAGCRGRSIRPGAGPGLSGGAGREGRNARRAAATLRGRSAGRGTPAATRRGARSRRSADASHAGQRPPERRGARPGARPRRGRPRYSRARGICGRARGRARPRRQPALSGRRPRAARALEPRVPGGGRLSNKTVNSPVVQWR